MRYKPLSRLSIPKLLTIGLVVFMTATSTQPSRYNISNAEKAEYKLKAIFLYNFTQYVEWPDSVMRDATIPFRVGIVGNDPFGAILDEVMKGESVKGHPIKIERYTNSSQIKDCNILFFAGDADTSEKEINKLQPRNVLTVGENLTFNKRGGIIRFYPESRKIRFSINVEAADSSGLKISSKLLRLADVSKAKGG